MSGAKLGSFKSVLTVNAGSSSLRLAFYSVQPKLLCLAKARLEPDTSDPAVLTNFLRQNSLPQPAAIMHRVVHGGSRLKNPMHLDATVEAEIERLVAVAPLHNHVALNWIRAARLAFGAKCPQGAAFDTGFFAGMPRVARKYAIPQEMCEHYEIHRYGFHGLAHQSMLDQWVRQSGDGAGGRVVSLQLGAGCSIAAIASGQPVDTSMGFSPLEGLMMATRSGDIDPGMVIYLIDEAGFSGAEVQALLNERSGLLGVSGESADLSELLASNSADAALAIAMFCYRIRKYLGSYLAVLGGADAILLGGGIGEHLWEIRARILEDFAWAGIQIDLQANRAIDPNKGGPIHHCDSQTAVWVLPVSEEQVLADAACKLFTPQ